MDTRFANGCDHAQARSAMLLDPSVTNLNTGSFGPLPSVVFERVTQLRQRLAEEPMDFLLREMPAAALAGARKLAAFLGGDPRRLIFTANVTASINIVACGLILATPGEILLTDHEYGAMHWCWERAAQRQGLTMRTFPLPILAEDPRGDRRRRRAPAMTSGRGCFFFSHVLSPTGLVLPAKRICAEARRRGILTVVDGAHAPAMVPLAARRPRRRFLRRQLPQMAARSDRLRLSLSRQGQRRPRAAAAGELGLAARPPPASTSATNAGSTPRIRLFEFEGTRDSAPGSPCPPPSTFRSGLGFEQIRHAQRTPGRVRPPALRRAPRLDAGDPDASANCTAS